MARKQLKSKVSASTTTVIDAPVVVKQKVSTKKNIAKSTPDHLNPSVKDCSISTNWKDMQSLAKEWGIKAGGRGVTSDILHHWLCQYQKFGRSEFATKYPDAMSKAPKKVDASGNKVAIVLPKELAGLSFREAQAYVKQYRESKIVRGHKGKFDTYCKTFAIGGEIVKTAATTWDGIINQLVAIDAYVETKM